MSFLETAMGTSNVEAEKYSTAKVVLDLGEYEYLKTTVDNLSKRVEKSNLEIERLENMIFIISYKDKLIDLGYCIPLDLENEYLSFRASDGEYSGGNYIVSKVFARTSDLEKIIKTTEGKLLFKYDNIVYQISVGEIPASILKI